MTRPITNDGGIDREMTEAEHAEWLAFVADSQAAMAHAQIVANAKQSALDKLKALGLTDDEIAALVG